MNDNDMVQKLIAVGGNEWTKADKHRIYFNDLPQWYGLECRYYNSGNIMSARLDGSEISNSDARRIMANMPEKLWYDVTTAKFMVSFSTNTGKQIGNEIVAAILEKASEVVTQ